jgi:hypothetical protein
MFVPEVLCKKGILKGKSAVIWVLNICRLWIEGIIPKLLRDRKGSKSN